MDLPLTALVKRGYKEYVALCLEVDVVSSGRTVHEAIENLSDAVREFLEYVHEERLEHELLPRPVNVTALREFLECEPSEYRHRGVRLKGYRLEVAAVG